MRKFLTYIKIEGLLSIRCIDIIFFGVIMPIGISALIAGIVGSSQTSEGYTFLQGTFGALITVGICATSLMAIPLSVADYRDKKILKQFFVTPTHPAMILLVQVIINAICSIISSVLVYLMLTLFFGYTIEGSLGMVIISYLLVMFAMYGIGMLIASICRTIKLANLVCTLVYFPMLFLSGATIPIEIFPSWLQSIAQFLPLTKGIELLKNYSLYVSPSGMETNMIILLVIGVIAIGLSVYLFRWE